MKRALCPVDPMYSHWRVVPEVIDGRPRRTWVRDDGLTVRPEGDAWVGRWADRSVPTALHGQNVWDDIDDAIEEIEQRCPYQPVLGGNHPVALWRQLAKGRRYAMLHQAFLDLYVIWREETKDKTRIGFKRAVNEDLSTNVIEAILQGRPGAGEHMTLDRLHAWVCALSVYIVNLGGPTLTLTLTPGASKAKRLAITTANGCAEDYYILNRFQHMLTKTDEISPPTKWLLGGRPGRRLLATQPNLDILVRPRHDASGDLGHRIRGDVHGLRVDNYTGVAMLLWFASGLTLDAWHKRLELEFDCEPAFRGDGDPLSSEEFEEINEASYAKRGGLEALVVKSGTGLKVDLVARGRRGAGSVLAWMAAPTLL